VTDLTVVSCLASCLGPPDFDAAMALLQPLLTAGVPAVVYVDEDWMEPLHACGTGAHVRLQATSPQRRLESLAFSPEIAVAWQGSTRAELPGLDYFVASLSKMGMLHDQSIWNPFGTRHLAWIDADIAASVHWRHFTDDRLLDRLPMLLQRFLFLSRPGAVTDAAGTPGTSRVQAQLFGGALADIAHANALYYSSLERAVRDGRLPTDESIFTTMMERCPERFDRVVLQDNGLAGLLFEQVRSGRVSIERTVLL
jgi:hypothetical protein